VLANPAENVSQLIGTDEDEGIGPRTGDPATYLGLRWLIVCLDAILSFTQGEQSDPGFQISISPLEKCELIAHTLFIRALSVLGQYAASY